MDITQMDTCFGIIFRIVAILMIGIMFVIVVYITAFTVSNLKKRSRNRKSPRLDVSAKVLGKRAEYYRYDDRERMASYYATFEVNSGDRMELEILESEYGLLFEGDKGILTFQGTEFISFVRKTK